MFGHRSWQGLHKHLTGMPIHKQVINEVDILHLEGRIRTKTLYHTPQPLNCQCSVVGHRQSRIPQRNIQLIMSIMEHCPFFSHFQELSTFYWDTLCLHKHMILTEMQSGKCVQLIIQVANHWWDAPPLLQSEELNTAFPNTGFNLTLFSDSGNSTSLSKVTSFPSWYKILLATRSQRSWR